MNTTISLETPGPRAPSSFLRRQWAVAPQTLDISSTQGHVLEDFTFLWPTNTVGSQWTLGEKKHNLQKPFRISRVFVESFMKHPKNLSNFSKNSRTWSQLTSLEISNKINLQQINPLPHPLIPLPNPFTSQDSHGWRRHIRCPTRWCTAHWGSPADGFPLGFAESTTCQVEKMNTRYLQMGVSKNKGYPKMDGL